MLRDQAERDPARPFVVFERAPHDVDVVHYGAMLERAQAVAVLLHSLGVGRGDRVNVHLTNCVEVFDCWFGAALVGAVIVPTNPAATRGELAYILGHAGCTVSVTQPGLADMVHAAADDSGVVRHRFVTGGIDGVDGVDGFADLTAAVCVGPWTPPSNPAEAADPAAVLYTSGTTSRPKGVVVSHAAYVAAGDAVAGHVRLRPEDRQLVVLPLFHGNAQYYSTMSALVTGASLALVPRFSASRWSEQAATLGATVASLFAAPMRMILAAAPSRYDRAHALRVGLFAQNLTSGQIRAFEERFGVPMAQLYGMTETVVPPTINPVYGDRRPDSIGRPILGARLRVVDDAGRDVDPGVSGELLVGGEPGYDLMSCYLDAPDQTARVLRDGWLHTGDTVRADEDGYLYFVDRAKDLIKRAGENVATGEVERVIDEHPAVFESAVVGVPDDMYDEAVKAFVVLVPGAHLAADELRTWCAERLARFKVPEHVEMVAELPRTSVGKIQKHLLRAVGSAIAE